MLLTYVCQQVMTRVLAQNSHGLTAKPLAQDSPRLSVRANRHVTRGQLEKTVIV